MKGGIAIIVMGLLITGAFVAVCQNRQPVEEGVWDFEDLVDDYEIVPEENQTYFKSHNRGDIIRIKDTVAATFIAPLSEGSAAVGTGVYFRSVGTENHTKFNSPIGLGFVGNETAKYAVGEEVVVLLEVTGETVLNETLVEFGRFRYLYVAAQLNETDNDNDNDTDTEINDTTRATLDLSPALISSGHIDGANTAFAAVPSESRVSALQINRHQTR